MFFNLLKVLVLIMVSNLIKHYESNNYFNNHSINLMALIIFYNILFKNIFLWIFRIIEIKLDKILLKRW